MINSVPVVTNLRTFISDEARDLLPLNVVFLSRREDSTL